jgi:hypothetical protein
MSNKPIYHYVYRITNIIENKHYYGKRSSIIEPKLDLGKKYFSSSRDKEFMKDQKENPQNYKYKIIKLFNTSIEAIAYESKLHYRFDVGVNESFYNRAKQKVVGFDSTGVKFTYEQKMAISGHKSHKAIPIDIYNYYTGEMIAENVIPTIWCKENGYAHSSLNATIKSDTSKPHCSTNNSEKHNLCHVKGIYAVRHGDEPKNFSKNHIEDTKYGCKGHKSHKAIPIDIYNYYTGEMIAENVISKVWCRENGYSYTSLNATVKSDPSKPHCGVSESENYNLCHTKGICAVLHGHEPKNFSKEHIEDAKNVKKGFSGVSINIYNYYTDELIAKNVISKVWCRENGYSYTALNQTIKSDRSKPHNSYIKSPNFNVLHTKGIYAVLHGDEPKKFSKEHYEYTKQRNIGHKNPQAIPIDIYDYFTDKLIAENVISRVWCRENGYSSCSLNDTIKSDPSKPHNANGRNAERYNPHHTKGIYARIHNPE